MAHKFINQIQAGEQINDTFLIRDPILRSTSNGGLYIAMYIGDKTGELNGRMWQATEAAYESLPKPGFVHIVGRSEMYKNNMQIVVNNFGVVDSSKVNSEDFLARTDKDVDKMFEELKQLLRPIKNAQIQTLLGAFFADEELMTKFRIAPAAMKMHHNYLGGLLEHTYNMMKVATAILPLYPKVNNDLVLGGIFLHDIGKVDELSYDMAFSYTDSGQLIGHIVKSVLMVTQKGDELAGKGKRIDSEILDSIIHILLSHHGQYEFGSPKLPATAEAFMVNYIDDLDAKIEQVTKAIENDPGSANWTEWKNPLQTRLYRKRIE